MGRPRKKPLEGTVRAMGRGGEGAVETEQGTLWVPEVFPGETVRVVPAGRRSARLSRVETAHPARREPPCPHAAACGGCPWMALEPGSQAELKAGWGREMAQRLGLDGDVPILTDRSTEYRRRARLAWHWRGGQCAMGYRRAQSSRLVDVDRCLVQQPELQTAWTEVRSLATALRGSGEIRLYRQGDGCAALLSTGDDQPAEVYAALAAKVEAGSLQGAALRVQGGAPALFGTVEERYEGADGGDAGRARWWLLPGP